MGLKWHCCSWNDTLCSIQPCDCEVVMLGLKLFMSVHGGESKKFVKQNNVKILSIHCQCYEIATSSLAFFFAMYLTFLALLLDFFNPFFVLSLLAGRFITASWFCFCCRSLVASLHHSSVIGWHLRVVFCTDSNLQSLPSPYVSGTHVQNQRALSTLDTKLPAFIELALNGIAAVGMTLSVPSSHVTAK